MQKTDIESELSYAYLHAVAAKAGMSCSVAGRHQDNNGCDATLNYFGKTEHPYFTDVQLNIQLKATIKESGSYPDHHSYFIQGASRYEKLRAKSGRVDNFLVVLFLPSDPESWLRCDPERLILMKSAYWVNLYGAESSSNATGQTVYLPKSNLLTPESLIQLVNWSVTDTIPAYTKPKS